MFLGCMQARNLVLSSFFVLLLSCFVPNEWYVILDFLSFQKKGLANLELHKRNTSSQKIKMFLKFIFSKKATKIDKIFTVDLTFTT